MNFVIQSTFIMDGLNVWLRAQVYNLIIGCIISFIVSIICNQQMDSNSIAIYLLIAFIAVSFIVGCPLIIVFMFIDKVIFKLKMSVGLKMFIQLVAYPLATFSFLLLLAYLFFVDHNTTFLHVVDDEVLLFAIPSVISTLLSVVYFQYSSKASIN